MNYKETLLFIGKCLTITHEKHNRELIEKELKLNNIDWDSVVKVSTSHYVFPALYCNLKRAGFLHYLPEDLVSYMKHITDLNRERNEKIIAEAKEINELLLKNNITPIFLKGAGNLLDNLYEDIAERMLGDIDFLVDNKSFFNCIDTLKNHGYFEAEKYFIDYTILSRHYPKLISKKKCIIEVHYKMINNDKYFNYDYVIKTVKKSKKKPTVLSYKNQLLLTYFNKQINDKGQWTKNIAFRDYYDLYLLSKHVSTKETINDNHLKNKYLNNFIASASFFFNESKSLQFIKTKKANKFLKNQLLLLEKPFLYIINNNLYKYYFSYNRRLSVILKSLYLKKYRIYLFKRLLNFLKI